MPTGRCSRPAEASALPCLTRNATCAHRRLSGTVQCAPPPPPHTHTPTCWASAAGAATEAVLKRPAGVTELQASQAELLRTTPESNPVRYPSPPACRPPPMMAAGPHAAAPAGPLQPSLPASATTSGSAASGPGAAAMATPTSTSSLEFQQQRGASSAVASTPASHAPAGRAAGASRLPIAAAPSPSPPRAGLGRTLPSGTLSPEVSWPGDLSSSCEGGRVHLTCPAVIMHRHRHQHAPGVLDPGGTCPRLSVCHCHLMLLACPVALAPPHLHPHRIGIRYLTCLRSFAAEGLHHIHPSGPPATTIAATARRCRRCCGACSSTWS